MTDLQPQLPLEWPDVAEHFTIELRTGPMHDELTTRRHEAKTREDAEKLIEGMRDTCAQRDGVSWQFEETNAEGKLYGLGPKGLVYQIVVSPPLPQS
jgi:hypothetical protein